MKRREQEEIENRNSSLRVRCPRAACVSHSQEPLLCHEAFQGPGLLPLLPAPDLRGLGPSSIPSHGRGLQDTKPWFILGCSFPRPPTQLPPWSKELDSFSAMCISHSQSSLLPPRVMDGIHVHTRSQRLNPILSKPGQDLCRKWKSVVKITVTSQCNTMTWNWHDFWRVSSLPTPGYCVCVWHRLWRSNSCILAVTPPLFLLN